MSKSLTTKNFAAVVLGLGLVLALSFSFAAPVKAQTVADLQAQIQALLAQIAGLQGGSTTSGACYTFTMNLTIGASNTEVMQLQKFLNSKGYTVATSGAGSVGNETSYFGGLTASAVAKFQAANGIAPAVGYFGPLTRSKVNAMCMPGQVTPGPVTPGATPTPSGPLQGSVGTVESYKLMSTLSNEEVGEDQSDVEVAGLEVEVDDGSDLELTAVRLNFDVGTAGSDFEKYADDVSIWLEGEEIGRVDADQFNDDNAFASTISLDGDNVIRAGDTAELVVAISGISNLDSADATDTWTVDITSVRFVDASGASTSEDPATGTRTFSFEAFATASDAELKIAADDDDINDAHLLDVHASNKTSGVELASFTLEAEGDSDLEIKKFGINVDVAGTADDISDVVSGGASPALYLEIEGETYGTATYGGDSTTAYTEQTTAGGENASENVLFDDVDYTINAGDKVSVKIIADLVAVSGDLTEGDTIQVTLTETETDNTALVDVEDEANEQLADADLTGTLTTGAHAAFDVGIIVDLVSADSSVLSNDNAVDNDIGTFTMVLDITAFGGSVYVGDTAAGTTVADGSLGTAAITDAIVYRVYDSGSATTDDLADTVTFTTPSGVTDSTDNILITEGATSRVTVTVTQTNDTAEDDGIYYMDLAAIYWATTDTTTYANEYIYDLDEFETATVSLN